MLLLRALGGSHLYGVSRPDSDWDWYEVHDHIIKGQTKVDGQDVIQMSLSAWIRNFSKGTHQALDALWCPPELCEVDLIQAYRYSVRIDPFLVADTLERSARNVPDEKHRERLFLCGRRVREQGWYDPTEWGRIVNGL